MVTRKVNNGRIGCSIGSMGDLVLIQCQTPSDLNNCEQVRVSLTIEQAEEFIENLKIQLEKLKKHNTANEK